MKLLLLALVLASMPAISRAQSAAPAMQASEGSTAFPAPVYPRTMGGSLILRPDTAAEPAANPSWSFFRTGGALLPLWVSERPHVAANLDLMLDLKLEPKAEKISSTFGRPSPPGSSSVSRSTASGRLLVRLAPSTSLWQPYAGYGFSSTTIRGEPGPMRSPLSLRGVDGGSTAHVFLGLIHDTRDDPVDSRRGGSQEVAARIASSATGSAYEFTQLTLSVRHFIPLGSRLVLGGRLVGDLLLGDVPFFESSSIGGIQPFQGLGGSRTIRGVPSERYPGTAKVLANLELRAVLGEAKVWGHRVRSEAVAFIDGGSAWSPGVPGLPHSGLLLSGGGGLRLVSGPVVVRLDAGISREGGGVYFGFGHVF